MRKDNTPDVVWKPIPNSSQSLALAAPCHHILYHGARGPGKTITQLMRFRSRVGLGYGEYWRGIIFDREYKNLSDLIAQSKRFFPKFFDGATFKTSASDLKWVWPTGEELLFRHIKKDEDYENFHGHEYPFIGWNELTKYPTGYLYQKMMSTNRSSFRPQMHTPRNQKGEYLTADGNPLPPIPLEVFSTTNPSGPGHNWVKRRFITPAPNGHIVKKEVPVFNPQTQADEIVVKTQVAIFGSYRENIYLPPEYVAELEMITDPNLRRAWLYGDWSVVSGGALDDVWEAKKHIITRFTIPSSWRIFRAFDWGSATPFSVGWWAVANGEEATLPDGRTFCPQPGTLIRIDEWYGSEELGTDIGLKFTAREIAQEINKREQRLLDRGWIEERVMPGPADTQIHNERQREEDTIAKQMSDHGVDWIKANKVKDSRINGLEVVRQRFKNVGDNEDAGMYIMENCRIAIDVLPTLPRDPDNLEDVDTDCEDHLWDETRYMALYANEIYPPRIKFRHL